MALTAFTVSSVNSLQCMPWQHERVCLFRCRVFIESCGELSPTLRHIWSTICCLGLDISCLFGPMILICQRLFVTYIATCGLRPRNSLFLHGQHTACLCTIFSWYSRCSGSRSGLSVHYIISSLTSIHILPYLPLFWRWGTALRRTKYFITNIYAVRFACRSLACMLIHLCTPILFRWHLSDVRPWHRVISDIGVHYHHDFVHAIMHGWQNWIAMCSNVTIHANAVGKLTNSMHFESTASKCSSY